MNRIKLHPVSSESQGEFMNLKEAFLLLFTHGLPIVFFTYMATDVLLRNKQKTEHILLSIISLCYLLLFAEEYIRSQVSIEHSPMLSALWLSSVGIAIPGLGLHFLVKLTRLDAKMPKFIYPYVFYLPLIFIFMNLVTGAQWISAQEFVQTNIWKLPVYNAGYYQAMSASILINLSYLVPLLIAKSKPDITLEQKSIYNQLVFGVIVSVIFHIIFGYINFGDSLPPYPYLYSGVVWCYFLRHTMRKHDFLNLYDKRYEKLFDMNPDAILLIDRTLAIKNANPGAVQFFQSIELKLVQFFNLLDSEIKDRMQASEEIKHCETEIYHQNKRLFLLINADYVWIDNDKHILLIIRDITVQKQHQEEVKFLAYHDPLTRLPNRRYFHEKLEEALRAAERNRETLALLLIDLDRIKLLNDTRGHLAGDETLQYAAEMIREAVGERGTAARMGGDEFILFIRHSPSDEEINRTIERMREKFSRFVSKYGDLPVGMSVGVSRYPQDGIEGQALIHIADDAMYAMKRSRA